MNEIRSIRITHTSKAQLADLYQISSRTLAYYLNQRYYEQMKTIGYNKTSKTLSPKEVSKLVDLIGMPFIWKEEVIAA
jgi:hypothetical protein